MGVRKKFVERILPGPSEKLYRTEMRFIFTLNMIQIKSLLLLVTVLLNFKKMSKVFLCLQLSVIQAGDVIITPSSKTVLSET
ncbi:hypothetical protein ASG97_21385 [Bacillus sp. Soil745]|nr:hypothetical protein ASG97_21385 [Bacillus sp. Soil745]